jgi:hypothetical protein
MGNPNDPFADIEFDWEKSEKAAPGASTGRLPVHNCYRGVIVPFDFNGDGNVMDHFFLNKEGVSMGVKICIEILDPEKVEDETVKGKSYEHMFWLTPASWPYVQRDVEVIFGKVPKHPKQLLDAVWAGRTIEFGLRDELRNGFMNSRATHFVAWTPGKEGDKKAEADKKTEKVEKKGEAQKPANSGKKAATAAPSKTQEDW